MKRSIAFASLVGLTLTLGAPAAQARPAIASGDRLLNTNLAGCLSQADRFINSLKIESDRGPIDRTGYFDDGSFRILCYEAGQSSLAVIFATHEESGDVASNFIRMALTQLGEAGALTQQPSKAKPKP
ncbi:MAG: hypothetical protein KGQ93_00035 [Cyanobacteria bacterium REEB459]|nr:hypothetical protein [Cyanobacteria bacterium REEB459]